MPRSTSTSRRSCSRTRGQDLGYRLHATGDGRLCMRPYGGACRAGRPGGLCRRPLARRVLRPRLCRRVRARAGRGARRLPRPCDGRGSVRAQDGHDLGAGHRSRAGGALRRRRAGGRCGRRGRRGLQLQLPRPDRSSPAMRNRLRRQQLSPRRPAPAAASRSRSPAPSTPRCWPLQARRSASASQPSASAPCACRCSSTRSAAR